MPAHAFDEILESPVVKSTITGLFGEMDFEVVERPGALVIKLQDEPESEVSRIILLKPFGFTSNSLGELSSHPEAAYATAQIRGAVRPGSAGFFRIKRCVDFRHYADDNWETLGDVPYAGSENSISSVKSSGSRFVVVKGKWGFYHSLVNLTGRWIAIILHKKLRSGKGVDKTMLERLSDRRERDALASFLKCITDEGDGIFDKDIGKVDAVVGLDPRHSLPVLINFLNVPEEGRHEQCSVFSTILKVARRDPKTAMKEIGEAERSKAAAQYYLRELYAKISKMEQAS